LVFKTFITGEFNVSFFVLLFHFYLSVTKLTVALSIGLLYH